MNVYANKSVLIDNWYEDKYGTIPSKNESNWNSTYQRDYHERVLPTRDNSVMRNIRERSLGMPINLFREHGVHNAYNKNMSSLYDLNCMAAYNPPLYRRYNSRSGLWKPEQNFTANYGPGRNELLKKKQTTWNSVINEFIPSTEYQCSYTTR
ncbi:uncharacterized protein LOC132938536 [Metopolophium dirhodum]|uniref:uncharacterized protein LOC132938536 n=1 Tax=Metopolophium dirhodum TaxID=44670 RepID=UPI00298F97A6|nr:uncharacterized protein LOC132938536 [Metopolophium dirhodum]